MVLSSVRNPPSTQPTASFSIYVRGPSGSTINYIVSGITVTMDTAIATTSMNIVPDSLTVGSTTTYTFTITQAIDIHQINDYAVLSLPSLMALPTTVSCTVISGISSINCIRASATSLKVVYLAAPSSSTISFSLANMQNYLIGDQATTYSLNVFNSGNYPMEKYTSYALTYSESTLTTVAINHDDNIALGEASNITLTVTNSFSLYSSLDRTLTQLDVTIPAQFTIGTTCTVTGGGTCSPFSSSVYRITNVGLSLTSLNINLNSVVLDYFNPTSPSFSLVYTYNSYNVSAK